MFSSRDFPPPRAAEAQGNEKEESSLGAQPITLKLNRQTNEPNQTNKHPEKTNNKTNKNLTPPKQKHPSRWCSEAGSRD